MNGQRRHLLLRTILLALAAALLAPAGAPAATLALARIAATNGGGGWLGAATVRTSNGTLHLVYATQVGWSGGFDGIGATSISPSGHVSPVLQALSGWKTGGPGLLVTPTGSLDAVFGGDPDVGGTSYSGPWGIVSSNGGLTWSAPVDVGSHSNEAFGGDITARLARGTPVLTVASAGGLVIQHGLGTGSPTNQLNPQAGRIGGVDSALDSTTGDVVASWYTPAGARRALATGGLADPRPRAGGRHGYRPERSPLAHVGRRERHGQPHRHHALQQGQDQL